MKILIQPTIDNLREDLGYDDYEDVDEESLLFQQGFDGTPMDVEDGEKFEIPEGYIGSIIEDDEVYYLKTEIADGVWDKEELYGDLEAGSYMLNDGVISLVDEENDGELFDPLDYDDEENDDETDDEDEYDIVLNEVSRSALKAIGLDSEDEQSINLMGAILIGMSSEESDDAIAGRAFAQLVMSGFMLPMEDIKEMCRKTREKCKKQVFGLQIAFSNLREYNCSAEEALSQIQLFL